MDLLLTLQYAPKLRLSGEDRPLFFGVLALKACAEKLGRTFEDFIREGWKAADLNFEALEFFVGQALAAAEARRVEMDGGPETDMAPLAARALELYHYDEIVEALLIAYTQAPGVAIGAAPLGRLQVATSPTEEPPTSDPSTE